MRWGLTDMTKQTIIAFLGSIAAFTLLSLQSPTSAQAHGRTSAAAKHRGHDQQQRAERRKLLRMAKLLRFDINRDGKLQPNERAAIKQQFDRNRDGKLDREERVSLRQQLRATARVK
jgi:EF hand